ncbi:hypothetical protein [Bradyrhizobium sp. 27S5]|uniref:hypothetical protein n=1 Tax=Bradyrhizobium sp. 27S5 TaxID=3139728 RepID=UPI0030D0D361
MQQEIQIEDIPGAFGSLELAVGSDALCEETPKLQGIYPEYVRKIPPQKASGRKSYTTFYV